jgi:excinuclease ABC subunit B
MTGSLERAMSETERRREIQITYNKKHGITPETIKKNIRNILEEFGLTPSRSDRNAKRVAGKKGRKYSSTLELDLKGDTRPIGVILREKEKQMKEAARGLEFELAAILRDEIAELRRKNKKN